MKMDEPEKSEEELRRERCKEHLRALVPSLDKLARLEPTRELSLAITNAEQSAMWFDQHVAKQLGR